MVIECADAATCHAIAQQMRELITIAIWATMLVTIAAAGLVEVWRWLVSDTADTKA